MPRNYVKTGKPRGRPKGAKNKATLEREDMAKVIRAKELGYDPDRPKPEPRPVRPEVAMNQVRAAFNALMLEKKKGAEQRRLETMYAKTDEELKGKGGPYPWQKAFHDAGAENMYRAILAANRQGKTRTAAAEVALHATGRYDLAPWWVGKRFDVPVDVWVCGNTNQDVRDIQQLELLGKIDENRRPYGTGWLPFESLGTVTYRQCGVTNVVDMIQVKHVSGGWSTVGFKSFEQTAVAFQGTSKHLIWFDEEPENDPNNLIFSEAILRLATTDGVFMFTRTPKFGRTAIVSKFLAGGLSTFCISVGWDQAPHLTEDMKEKLLSGTPEHMRDTVSKGVPLMGSGGVYPVADSLIEVDAFEIPSYWRRIAGIDFGIDHPAAAAWLAHDPDADVVYLYDCYKQSGQTAAYHADAIKTRGQWIPVAWPHDGIARDKGGGVQLHQMYRDKGVNLLADSARFDDDKGGPQSRERGSMELLERMNTGRFKVFRQCSAFMEEKRMLHRKDGLIVAEHDDIESAVRYAMMMLRCARSDAQSRMKLPDAAANDYDPLAEFSRSA